MNLKKYLEFTKMGFRTSVVYRLNSLASLINSFIFLALMYALWSAIAASGELEGGLEQVLAYIILGQVISSSIFMSVEQLLTWKIREGTIVNELKRPMSLRSQVYFNMLGIMLFNFLFVGLPMLLISFLFLGLEFPGFKTLAEFLVALFLGYNIVYGFSYSSSMLIFWTKTGWSIRMMRTTVQRLFSGVYFPLYLLPASIAPIFAFLPFQSMVDGPITIFLQPGEISALSVFTEQIIWIVAFLILGELMWLKAKEKITIQGG